MLKHFRVQNYKCLTDVSLALTPIHVVIGQNDTGKTSLLEAMLALSRSAETSLAEAFFSVWKGRELVNEHSEAPRIEFDAVYGHFSEHNSTDMIYHLDIEFQSNNEKHCRNRDEWIKNPEHCDSPRKNTGATAVYQSLSLEEHSRVPFVALAKQMGPASIYRFDPKSMATPAALDPNRKFRLDADGFGLATLLGDILEFEAERFILLRGEFCGYFPQFRSIRIETEQAQSRHLNPSGSLQSASLAVGKGIYFETTQGTTIRAQQVSDGAILFLGLLALIHSPHPPKLLLIEEPEKGVYPKRLEQIIKLIRRIERRAAVGHGAPDRDDDAFPVVAECVPARRGHVHEPGRR